MDGANQYRLKACANGQSAIKYGWGSELCLINVRPCFRCHREQALRSTRPDLRGSCDSPYYFW